MPKISIKPRIVAVFGGISAFFGSAGAAIAGFGLCPCVLTTVFSVAAVIAIVMSFLSRNKLYLLTAGIILLVTSLILSKMNKTCPVHAKKRKK
jgi:uncharacterized membrane protein